MSDTVNKQMDGRYKFSVGQGVKDNAPKLFVTDTFEGMCDVILKDYPARMLDPIEGADGAENKRRKEQGYWFACPYADNKRSKKNALPRSFIIIDVDSCAKENLPRAKSFCERFKCFLYASFSSTDEAPRFRIVFDASRDILPEEMPAVTRYLGSELVNAVFPFVDGGTHADLFTITIDQESGDHKTEDKKAASEVFAIDKTTGQAERIFLCPPPCFTSSAIRFNGAAVDVETALKNAPSQAALNPAKQSRKQTAGATAAEGVDPVLAILKEKGFLGKALDGSKWTCVCPFNEEHSAPYTGGEIDSSCVFYETGAPTQEGGRFAHGFFKCQHEHCAAKEQSEFFQTLGISYADYCSYVAGNTESRFTSPSGVTYYPENDVLIAETQTKDGVFKRPVCNKLTVRALSFDKNGANPILWLQWFNALTGKVIEVPLPKDDLYSLTADCVMRRLVSKGLQPREFKGAQGLNLIVDFLRSYPLFNVPTRISLDRVGWFTLPKHLDGRKNIHVFVTPAFSLGEGADKVMYTGGIASSYRLSSSGALKDWIQNVASFGNLSSRVRFAIACAFAAPCLKILSVEGGIFNISGSSSKGKSTAQMAGASVYGSPKTELKPWDSTGTAIEIMANDHNDMLLCLDDGGTADGRTLYRIIYILINGSQRGRGTVDSSRGGTIGTRELPEPWHVLTLSTSELSAGETMRTLAKHDITAGQQVRFIDIPAVVDPDHLENGIFERTGLFANTGAAAKALTTNANRYHGVAGVEWLKYLTDHQEESLEALNRHRKAFIERVKKEVKLSTQGSRALDRFAVVASAACVSTEQGLTGWQIDDVLNDMVKCAIEGLKPFNDDLEFKAMVKKLDALLSMKQSNFDEGRDPIGSRRPTSKDCYGLMYYAAQGYKPAQCVAEQKYSEDRKPIEVALIYRNTFEEAVSPLDRNTASRLLIKAGIMPVYGERQKSAIGVSQFQFHGHKYAGYLILTDELRKYVD